MNLIDKILYEYKISEQTDQLINQNNLWEDLDLLLQEIYDSNGNFHPVWEFVRKYKNVLKIDDPSSVHDKILVPLYNHNRITKKISFGEWLMCLLYFIAHNSKHKKDFPKINASFIKNNDKIIAYRGVPIDFVEKDINEIENEVGYKSFSTDKQTAIKFLQLGWAQKAFKDESERKGKLIKVEVGIRDVHIFNDAGYENEVILKTPLHDLKIIRL